MGPARRFTGYSPYCLLLLLDELILGRVDGRTWGCACSRRSGPPVRGAANKEPRAARDAVCGVLANPGYFPAIRRLLFLGPFAGVLRLPGNTRRASWTGEAWFNGAAGGVDRVR